MQGSLEQDLAALLRLRDESECDELKQAWSDEDPRDWKCDFGGRQNPCVQVTGEQVTTLGLSFSSLVALPAAIGELKALTRLILYKCSSLTALPAAIGELGALTELFLYEGSNLAALPDSIGKLGALTMLDFSWCSSLAALPAAIGELKALKTLDVRGCSSLVALPDTIGELGALEKLDLSNTGVTTLPDAISSGLSGRTMVILGSLDQDFAALRKLRDDGALKEYFGESEDPREWRTASGYESITVEDGRVTQLQLYKCSKLTALPEAIGELGALTYLNLYGCSNLAALPDSIGKLGALSTLGLDGCSSLTYPPEEMRGDVHNTVGFCCLNLLEGGDVSAADLKKSIVNHVITGGKLGRIDALASKDSAFADITESARADFAALRKLRDNDASGALKEFFGDGEDPREWQWGNGCTAATVSDGRVTALNLYKCTKLTALPDAIGELGALTTLWLSECSSLAELPDAIGKLDTLTKLYLNGCSSLAALPDAIGELKALTRLDLSYCSSLTALPESIGGLDALNALSLAACPNLVFPPGHTHGDATRVKRLLTNTTRLLAGELSAAEVDDEAKEDFLDGVIHHAPFADRLEEAVRKDPALADLTNDKGQRAIDLACLECRSAMQKALFFLGRYDVDKGPPEHRSATSLVVRAVDHEAADDYGKLFDEFDKDGSGTLDSIELGALATKLGTNVEILKLADGESYTKDVFVAKCQRLFGKERKVVIKIFQVEEQWRNEKKARDDQQLDARYVVQTIPAPTDDEFAKALGETNLFGEGVGSRAIVMDAANRNLFQIYQSERPDLNKVRVLMRETMECVQHLHEKGLVHGDIKMLNVVRLSLDNRLRLIDLDAAAKISRHGGDYACSKFSSAILPPECFAKLDADQRTRFEAYFEGVDAELREKVAPKVDKRGASYVVKTFSLDDKGAPKNVDDLPYELVEASVAVDYWSLGALLFQLVAGEPLVPSNRDDDCVNAKSMAILASWNDDAAKRNLAVIKDAAAWDLASKLLVRDPEQRAKFDIADTLARHPFFHPESGDAEIKKQLDAMKTMLDSVKADTSSILRLSEEHRDELRKTRSTLMRAIYEATEVSTPTAFVVLKEKLPTGEARVELTLNDDGTGFSVEGEAVDEAKDRYEESKTWLNLCARFGRGVAKCSPSAIAEAVAGACEELVVGEEMWLYLIDELTGKPVVPEGESIYPIRITKPAEVVAKLLPVMQVGLHAASLVNGVAGVVRLFGYPCPKVPEAWREGAQNSAEVLKQESSVEAFGAVHEKVQDGGEETETVRGAALRELAAFFAAYDPDREYAGLRRIGDEDGTAVWTLLTDPEEVKAAIEKRAAQRQAEARRRDERFQELMDNADAGSGAGETAAAAATPTTPTAAGGGTAAARALSTPRRETADSAALRRVEDRLASIEDRLQGLGNWFY